MTTLEQRLATAEAELAAICEEMKAKKLWPQIGDEYSVTPNERS